VNFKKASAVIVIAISVMIELGLLLLPIIPINSVSDGNIVFLCVFALAAVCGGAYTHLRNPTGIWGSVATGILGGLLIGIITSIVIMISPIVGPEDYGYRIYVLMTAIIPPCALCGIIGGTITHGLRKLWKRKQKQEKK
jgi:hypothetical protein